MSLLIQDGGRPARPRPVSDPGHGEAGPGAVFALAAQQGITRVHHASVDLGDEEPVTSCLKALHRAAFRVRKRHVGEDRGPWATSEGIPFTAENSSWPLPVKACEAASPEPARKLTTNAPADISAGRVRSGRLAGPRGRCRTASRSPGTHRSRRNHCARHPQAADLGFLSGAGDGNRTRALSLGSCERLGLAWALTWMNGCFLVLLGCAAFIVVPRCSPLDLVHL